ncbi:hypothetical protein [Ensifer sp. B1-9]|uniref:hypothetical protein n=1 Tax=Ensifer sp. B1-9 TaxID=3141455 RepID=UPI003D1DAC7E
MSETWSTISKHAVIRARQRGYSRHDITFVIEHGTEVPDGFFLREKDVQSMIQRKELPSKRLAERAIKLAGTFVPMTTDGCAASVYRPCARKCKHLLHGRYSAGRSYKRKGRQ